jgi:hypothetical protein
MYENNPKSDKQCQCQTLHLSMHVLIVLVPFETIKNEDRGHQSRSTL